MPKKIFLDSNIYLDYLENRSNGLIPLGEMAFQLIMRTIDCEFEIFLNDWVTKELLKYKTKKEISEVFDLLKERNKLFAARVSEKDLLKARRFSTRGTVPFVDLIHYFFCLSNKIDFLVTRDNHLLSLRNPLVPILTPETL